MDHGEVREILEDAAIEPNGLERLMAGDTTTASIVAGHLAACPDCAEELERMRRSVGLIQPAVRAIPPPELKARTLAYVAALGRPRGVAAAGAATTLGAAAGAGTAPGAASNPAPGPAPSAPPLVPFRPRRAGGARLGWVAGLAAALVVAVTGTTLVLNARHDAAARDLTAEIDALGDVTRWTLRVDAQPDVRRIELASATGAATSGNLVFSPSSTELVVVADGLTPAPAGREYRCWVEVDGKRTKIGRMFFGGEIAYWVGKVSPISSLAPGARFGVTLVDLAAADAPGEPVLVSAG